MHAHQSEHADGASRGKQRALQPIGAGASMTLVDSDDITTSCNSGRRKTPDTIEQDVLGGSWRPESVPAAPAKDRTVTR